jgi:hypothetical protein
MRRADTALAALNATVVATAAGWSLFDKPVSRRMKTVSRYSLRLSYCSSTVHSP